MFFVFFVCFFVVAGAGVSRGTAPLHVSKEGPEGSLIQGVCRFIACLSVPGSVTPIW